MPSALSVLRPIAALASALVLLPVRAGLLGAQEPKFTLAQFASLRWLEGRWQGSGGNVPRFFEEYTFVNDTTIEQREFGLDSTFSTAPEPSAIVLSQRRIVKQRRGATSAQAARIAGDTVWFEGSHPGAGFRWQRVDGGLLGRKLERRIGSPLCCHIMDALL